MLSTRYSLVQRVRDNRDEIAWQEFYDLYRPLLYRYSRQRGLTTTDADEVVGLCFARLTQIMADFQYQPSRGKFKSWLKQLVSNQIAHLRAGQRHEGLAPNSELDLAHQTDDEALWERAWQQEVLSYCVQQVRSEVSMQNYQIFRLGVYENWPTAQIAEVFGLSPEQVYRAKHKVLARIRSRLAEYRQQHPD